MHHDLNMLTWRLLIGQSKDEMALKSTKLVIQIIIIKKYKILLPWVSYKVKFVKAP